MAAGTIFNEWRQAWLNNAHKTKEFNTLDITTYAANQETGFIDIPNFGQPIWGIRLRYTGTLTTNGNDVRLATNLPGRAADVRIYKPDGRPLIYLAGNGGVRVNSVAPSVGTNDIVSPGDVVMFAEPFVGTILADNDKASGRLGPQTTTGVLTFDIFVPCYIPADAGTHKLQIRNNFTWVNTTGTVFAANMAKVTASNWTLEMIEECLPQGATMTYFGCTNPMTLGLVIGDNYVSSQLNRGMVLKSLIMQSALPANLGDLRFEQDTVSIMDTEYDDALAHTNSIFNYMDFNKFRPEYGLEEFGAGAAIVHSGHCNTVIIQPGDLLINEKTNLILELATAPQNLRILQVTLIDLPRTATTPEVVSTQPGPSTPVVAVKPGNSGPYGYAPGQQPKIGNGGLLGGLGGMFVQHT